MTAAEDTLVVAPLPRPPDDDSAPYLRLLHEALKRRAVDILRVERPTPALADDRRLDVVHLHWLEYLTRGEGPRGFYTVRAIWRLARLLITLRALRRRGKRVVWTIHNIKPHETRHRLLEALGPWATARIADALIVHSRYAGQRVAEGLGGANKLHVIPHGPFVELYPPASRRRTEVRAAIGLPDDAFTYLVFGQLRAYKLIPETIRAFRSLPDVNVRLVVAGIARHHDVREQIASVAAGDERVMLRFGYVPDDEVAELHLAADAAVLAYRELFSSGALVLALGFGLPVVAPRRGTAAEIADGPALETFEPCRLRSALAAVRNGDRAERRRAAFAAVEHFDWDSIASDTIRVYRGERPPDL